MAHLRQESLILRRAQRLLWTRLHRHHLLHHRQFPVSQILKQALFQQEQSNYQMT